MSNSKEVAKNATALVKENITITVSGVKALLEQGMDRKEIAEHFGKSVAEMKREVWSNPALKNLKKKSASTITLIDDTVETAETAEAPVAESVAESVVEQAVENVEAPVVQEEVAQSPSVDTGANWG